MIDFSYLIKFALKLHLLHQCVCVVVTKGVYLRESCHDFVINVFIKWLLTLYMGIQYLQKNWRGWVCKRDYTFCNRILKYLYLIEVFAIFARLIFGLNSFCGQTFVHISQKLRGVLHVTLRELKHPLVCTLGTVIESLQYWVEATCL